MKYLHNLIYFQGSQNRYPLAVSVWDSEVLTSPSLQVWIPLPQHGPPVVEGVFEQALDPVKHSFIGAKPAKLRALSKEDFLNSTADLQFNSTTKKEGIVIMNPPQYDHTTFRDYMILSKSSSSSNSIYQNVNKISNQPL